MINLLSGDVLEQLKTLADESVHCVVTSPPYFGLRDYGVTGQIGLEDTPEDYVQKMVEVFREVKRVLRDDGTCWLNLGDSYSGSNKGYGSEHGGGKKQATNKGSLNLKPTRSDTTGLKNKDLIGIPWKVAFALQADGWYLRSDIIWNKPNVMPESVRDRPTKCHEYIFLLTKKSKYFYDCEAIKEPLAEVTHGRYDRAKKAKEKYGTPARTSSKHLKNGVDEKISNAGWVSGRSKLDSTGGRNKRTVWTINPKPFKGAHFAVFPETLVEPCILAGTSEGGCCASCQTPLVRIVEKGKPLLEQQRACGGDEKGNYKGVSTKDYESHLAQNASDTKRRILAGMVEKITMGWKKTCQCETTETIPCTVLDPFSGSGTTGVVAVKHDRNYIGIELNPEYLEISEERINKSIPNNLKEFLIDDND